MDKKIVEEMIELAIKQLDFSYAPYSGFKVGAVLRTKEGTYFTGCNIENASYTPVSYTHLDVYKRQLQTRVLTRQLMNQEKNGQKKMT